MLIFIHGFNSSGNSEKAGRLSDEFTELQVVTPTCPYAPEQAIAALSAQIETELGHGNAITVTGSSLGGYYALYLAHRFSLPSILINPLVDQNALRKAIGPQRNYYTDESYDWTEEHCLQLDEIKVEPDQLQIRPLLLLDEKDEVINSHKTATHFSELAETHLFSGGSHRFDHMDEALPFMRSYIVRHQR